MTKHYTILNYGCQMNESDSEHYAGQLSDLGYHYTEDYHDADVILINTCCVRESAEKKILGKIGEMKQVKREDPSKVLCVTGCMAQKDGEDFLKKYPQVDLLIGTAHVNNFSAILQDYLHQTQRKSGMFNDLTVMPREFEGHFVRKSSYAAWVPIMYGCNNFCTYCIVPYVRGRERSRSAEAICEEIRKAVDQGYREFTLLGQNVNSYGNDLDLDYHFPDLLADIDRIPGEYLIRFMSSHPKDATPRLFDVMAASSHVAKQLHLPFQSGNDRVLKEMNRRYTRQQYLDLVNYAKRVMPGLVLTSDVIIGFPGETEAEAMDTVSLVEEVGFDALFTFIYSPRPGTKAAAMPDPATRAEKQKWFDRLLEVQNNMSAKLHAAYVGKTVRVLVDGESDDPEYPLTSRTEGNRLVRLKGDKALIGQFADVAVTGSNTWALYGEAV